MGITLGDLEDHNGYAARKLLDGTLISTDRGVSREFTAYIAACQCGHHPNYTTWTGPTEFPPTPEGERAAAAEWEELHARPLLAAELPTGLHGHTLGLLDALGAAAESRPLGVLGELRFLERAVDDLLVVAVNRARTTDASWQQIGDRLGMARQSAQQRFGTRAGS